MGRLKKNTFPEVLFYMKNGEIQKVAGQSPVSQKPGFRAFLFATLIFSALLCGCGTSSELVKSTEEFSVSCVKATDVTRVGLENFVTLDREKSAVQAADKKETLSEGLFRPFLKQEALQARYEALEALGAYAYALYELASLDVAEEVNKTARDFKRKLDSISGLLRPTTGSNENFQRDASSIVESLGNVVLQAAINKKKDDALKSVLPGANESVRKLCMLIASEFKAPNKETKTKGVLYRQMEYSYRELQQSIDERFKAASATKEKVELAKEYGELFHDKQVTCEFFESIGRSFDKIAKAHAELAKQATQGTSAQAALTSLVVEIRRLVALYKELQKSNS